MEMLKALLQPRPTPRQQLRQWQGRLRNERLGLDRRVQGIERTIDCLSKSAEVMKIVNDLMKAPELALTMQQFSKEMLKAEVMEEMVNETVDSALDSEDVEDEIEEEVEKVLAALGTETASQLPAAQRIKQDSMSRVPGQRQTINEGIDDDQEDLEEKRARHTKVRS